MQQSTLSMTTVTNTLSTGACAANDSVVSGSFYGRDVFNPAKTVRQIVAMLSLFYATQAVLLFLLNHTLGVASVYSMRRLGPLILIV